MFIFYDSVHNPPEVFYRALTMWMVASRATCPFGSGDIVISL